MKRIETCAQCGVEFVSYAGWLDRKHASIERFCSSKCWDAYRRRIRVAQKCVICGSLFEVTPSRAQRIVTCSLECKKERVSLDRRRAVNNIQLSQMLERKKHALDSEKR